MKVSTSLTKSLSFCFSLLVIIQKNRNAQLSSWHNIKFRGRSFLCWIVSSLGLEPHNSSYWIVLVWTRKITRNINVPLLSSKCHPITRLSVNILLFCSNITIYKSRVFSHIWLQVHHNQNIVYCVLKFGIWQEIWNTFRRVTPWRNPSKFVVLKHFGWNVLHKEYTTPFLFTIFVCVKKCVLCRIWVWSMWRNLSRNTAENDGNTLWKLHHDSPRLAKASRWNLSL